MATSVDLQNDAGFESIPATTEFEKWVKAALRASYDRFAEANRVLGEAKDLVSGPRLSPAESLSAMTTDADLLVEELLAEPVVAQPTHMSFDARGRLWVASRQ